VRNLVFWKPGTLLVIDDIETDRPRDLELRFHPVEKSDVRIEDFDAGGRDDGEGGPSRVRDRDGKPFPAIHRSHDDQCVRSGGMWLAIFVALGGGQDEEVGGCAGWFTSAGREFAAALAVWACAGGAGRVDFWPTTSYDTT